MDHCLISMSKFLLRDGSKISVDTQVDPEDVLIYTTLEGATVNALLSAKAESRLLKKIPSSLLTLSQRMQLLGQTLSALVRQ